MEDSLLFLKMRQVQKKCLSARNGAKLGIKKYFKRNVFITQKF